MHFCVETLPSHTFVDRLRHRAEQQPHAVGYLFLMDGEVPAPGCHPLQLTYAALDQKARAIAAHLQSLQAAGARALLLYPPGLDFITALFGCFYAGVIAVPVYPPRRHQSQQRLQAVVRDAQATFALTPLAWQPELQQQFTAAGLGAMTWVTPDHPELQTLDAAWTPPPLTPETTALLQYTSGSTGVPKGVVICHDNLLHNAAAIQYCFQDDGESLGVSWLPPYHDMGLIGGILQPLFVGRPMVLMSPTAFIQKPLRWLKAISHYGATTSGGPNFAYDLCVQKITPEQRTELNLRRWRVAFNGSESIRAQTLDTFAQTFQSTGFQADAFYPCYGMAEATLLIASRKADTPSSICYLDSIALEQHRIVESTPGAATTRAVVGCGQGWLDQKVMIVDPVTCQPCRDSEMGEIWFSSPSVAQGYWQRVEDTAAVFQGVLGESEGFFLRTGDLGFIRDGELFVTGRLKELIIIRGRNHYPHDLEWTVQHSHPALRVGHGAAFAIPLDGIERLVIVQEVARAHLRTLDGSAVFQAIIQAISQTHQLQVSAIALLRPGSLPKTSSGKVQRHACRTAFLEGTLAVLEHWQEQVADVREVQQAAAALLQQWAQPASAAAPENNDGRTAPLEKGTIHHRSDEIQRWMVANLALYLKVLPDTIDVGEPFSNFGLDSSVALSLTAELSDWLEQELDPTIFWEYPSIEALAHHLGTHP